MNQLFESHVYDPTQNLAIEEALLLRRAVVPSLFLWQNAHTVVIGCSQNAWKECRTALLTQEGGRLVRRSTGGGAVYHDLGNLNFSFVMPKGVYDVQRQLSVIRAAVAAFGIETVSSGRNDIVLKQNGAKFSGNAFRITQDAALHHGTILMDVDMAKLGRYLAPSPEKLKAKGVESVRARVGNLKDYAPSLTIDLLKDAVRSAFIAQYGQSESLAWEDTLELSQVNTLREKYLSWDWTYGRTPRFDITLSTRFTWGQIELLLSLKDGRVSDAQCYTDAMDAELSSRVCQALSGCVFTPSALAGCFNKSTIPEEQELSGWLAAQDL
jgi:lipoate-protein ligase A